MISAIATPLLVDRLRLIFGGQVFGKRVDHGPVLASYGLMSEVVPFVGIGKVVVEFFGAIVVADVAVAAGSQRVVVFAVGGECGACPRERWITEERRNGLPIEAAARRQTSQFEQCGVEIDEADNAIALDAALRGDW